MNTLSPLMRSFIGHFGEMGSRWGINRTVGQIYALIFVSPVLLNADDIAAPLEFSRGNVSMGLKELQIEPTLSMLRNALLETPASDDDRIAQERMRGMHDLIEMLMTWFDDVQRMDAATLQQLMKMGSKVQRLLEFTGKVKVVAGGKP